MCGDDLKSSRPWRVIAEEVSREQDSKKLSELVLELDRAMLEQGAVRNPQNDAAEISKKNCA